MTGAFCLNGTRGRAWGRGFIPAWGLFQGEEVLHQAAGAGPVVNLV